MSLEIIIDNRERKLIEILTEEKTNITITTQQLELGDIIFKRDGEIIFIIERKTVKDLKASICDGRNREQKARLLANFAACRIMYLIEGSLNYPLDKKITGVPVSTLLGSIINTQLRDGIHVYKTNNISETANFLIKLYSKLNKDESKFFTGETKMNNVKYSASLKKQKKSNMTPEVWFISLLSLIPQVTEKVAGEIVKVYPSVKILVQEYERTPEHLRTLLLANITYPIKNNKTRKIGKKMSERIYNFMFKISE